MSRIWMLSLFGGALLVGTACDYDPEDFLFPDVATIPSVIHLSGKDGDPYIHPAVIETSEDVREHVIFAEVGAPRTAAAGGVTMNFLGTGGDLCVWMDPEVAFWNQRVGNISNVGEQWMYPDNVFDDGDLDMYVGYSAYYTGSEGEEMGDFFVAYTDSLGNSVPIELSACTTNSDLSPDLNNPKAGRGSPEYCTIRATDPGISYTIALRTFTAPTDDMRLGFGLLLAEGTCQSLRTRLNAASEVRDECVITGEAIIPQGEDYGPWFGYDPERTWPRSRSFEQAFCDEVVADWCEDEAIEKWQAGLTCQWETLDDPDRRCFCGDTSRNPEVGSG